MNLSQFKLNSLSDSTWLDDYIAKKGETEVLSYKEKVYNQLEKLKVGEMLIVEDWVAASNFDLFIKIACCFVSETHCCYQFNNDYSIIKHQFDYETMVKITEKLRVQAHTPKTVAADSKGREPNGTSVELIPAP